MTIYLNSGETVTTYSCECFFLKIRSKDLPVHFPVDAATFVMRNGTETTGTVQSVGLARDSVPYVHTYHDETINFNNLDRVTFLKSVPETVSERGRELWLRPEIKDNETVTYRREEIELILLGFNYFSIDSDPRFIAIEHIDHIEYKTGGPGIVTGFLAGIGLLSDLVIGVIIII